MMMMPGGGGGSERGFGRGRGAGGRGGGGGGPKADCIRVQITKVHHPVSENLINQVFSTVEGIAPPVNIHVRPYSMGEEPVVAIVQFANPNDANIALKARNNCDIYTGCLHMNISFTRFDREINGGNNNNQQQQMMQQMGMPQHQQALQPNMMAMQQQQRQTPVPQHHQQHMMPMGMFAAQLQQHPMHQMQQVAPRMQQQGMGGPVQQGNGQGQPQFSPLQQQQAPQYGHISPQQQQATPQPQYPPMQHSMMMQHMGGNPMGMGGGGYPGQMMAPPYGHQGMPQFGGVPPGYPGGMYGMPPQMLAAMQMQGGRGRGAGRGRGGQMAMPGFPGMPMSFGSVPDQGIRSKPTQQELDNTVHLSIAMYPSSEPLIKLFNLLECWGGVVSLRRNHKNNDIVVAKMQSPADTHTVVRHLSRVPLCGSDCSARLFTTYSERNPPSSEGDPHSAETLGFDFTNFRHRHPSARGTENASHELILSGCAQKTESEVMNYFSENDIFPESLNKIEEEGTFRIRMDTVASAVKLLVTCQWQVCGSDKANIVFAEEAAVQQHQQFNNVNQQAAPQQQEGALSNPQGDADAEQ